MAAARYSFDVLPIDPTPNEENRNLPKPNFALRDEFIINQNNFQGWLRVWRMDISEENPNKTDIFMFAKENKEKFTDLVEQEIKRLENVKIGFGFDVKFKRERDGKTQPMEHYFRTSKEDPYVFFKYDGGDMVEQKFDKFIEKTKGGIEHWSEKGSGWEIERIMIAYVNVARYKPLRGGGYLPLPANLAKKKAIINVKNRDNECLKWSLRAALFPPKNGRDLQRPSKYPVNDGINYEGIEFPTPVNQIDKLEAQNKNLAINVFG